MSRVLVTLLITVAACGSDAGVDEERVARLRATMAAFESELAFVETQARSLSADWAEVTEGYMRAAQRYRDARHRYDTARASSTSAAGEFQNAAADWDRAAASWRFVQLVIRIAASMEAERLRTGSRPCVTTSTAAYRRELVARGIDLVGKDIDHIVPRSLGGADHVSNYQVLDSSLNRSLGNRWDVEKCAMTGDERCAQAIAVSAKCGTYRGGF